jgi:ATP-dependent Zn protease
LDPALLRPGRFDRQIRVDRPDKVGRRDILKEIRQIVDEQYERALEILNSNRDIQDQTAKTLLKSETIQGEELKALAAAVSEQSSLINESCVLQNRHALAA